jgi:hypothetical protein
MPDVPLNRGQVVHETAEDARSSVQRHRHEMAGKNIGKANAQARNQPADVPGEHSRQDAAFKGKIDGFVLMVAEDAYTRTGAKNERKNHGELNSAPDIAVILKNDPLKSRKPHQNAGDGG